MPNLHPDKPELLAPAGGPLAFRAAIGSGADAVYLGLSSFNARRSAENFTIETLADATRFAHVHGRRVYLTLNVVLLPGEVAEALQVVDQAWGAGIDAVIVQDLGLLRALRLALPHVRVHASTQLNTHSSATIQALASLGVERVTLSRETSIPEISELATFAHTQGIEVESFVHGAICVCYSGQCLLSSMIGGRSANRGMCAQPCRLPYELKDLAEKTLGDVGAHLLSPKDLAGIAVLPSLIASGVDSLKIEGRMKSPEYVSLVTGVYRAALDRAASDPDSYEVRGGELSVLSEAFSRGFSEAYLVGERGNDMMSYRRPNNRGLLIGRVASATPDRATITLDRDLDAEDTIEFWTSSGHFAQRAGQLEYDGGIHAHAPLGAKVTIATEQQASASDRVFRVRNAALVSAAMRSFEDASGPAIPLSIRVRMVESQPLLVEVRDDSGRSASAHGPVVESARTRAVTAEEICEHVGRLGGTPYVAQTWDIELSPNVAIGFSALHGVRREALAAYEQVVLEPWLDRAVASPKLPALPAAVRDDSRACKLVAVVSDAETAQACLAAGADEVHLTTLAWPAEETDDRVIPLVARIVHDIEAERLTAPAIQARRGVAGTLGTLAELAKADVETEAHWSLNALNAQAVAQLSELGASLVWLSPELTLQQVQQLIRKASIPLGVAVAGRQELMVTEHCILMAEGPCGQNCASCKRRQSKRFLKDRKDYLFPLVTDVSGRSHLYNAVPLDITHTLPELLDAGIAAIRIDLDTESPSAAAAEVGRVREALDRARRGATVLKSTQDTTSGHYFRGVS